MPPDNELLAQYMSDELTLEDIADMNRMKIKEVIAWQLDQAMREQKISKRRLAALMHTSRTQVDRMLDPNDGNVTIQTLQRAAAVVGRKVLVELV